MTTFKLPEPAHTHKWNHNPIYDVNFYTEAQLKQCVRDVLEQAAQIALRDSHMGGGRAHFGIETAELIRKMIGEIK